MLSLFLLPQTNSVQCVRLRWNDFLADSLAFWARIKFKLRSSCRQMIDNQRLLFSDNWNFFDASEWKFVFFPSWRTRARIWEIFAHRPHHDVRSVLLLSCFLFISHFSHFLFIFYFGNRDCAHIVWVLGALSFYLSVKWVLTFKNELSVDDTTVRSFATNIVERPCSVCNVYGARSLSLSLCTNNHKSVRRWNVSAAQFHPKESRRFDDASETDSVCATHVVVFCHQKY